MERECFLCGKNGSADPLDKHHIFGGSCRKKSEKLGLTVFLCHKECHIFGNKSVHKNPEAREKVKIYGQKKAMREQGWSIDDFRREFGKNYVEVE